MRYEQIKTEAEKLIKKYKTTDPFEIADYLKIRVVFEDYPLELNGLYQYVDRTQHIYINKNLPNFHKKSVCGHELGHARFHRDYNCIFLKTRTLVPVSRFEMEANLFSTFFIVDEKTLKEFENYSYAQIAAAIGLPEEHLMLRFKIK
jgi:Zn-dependent peptidase ImmA (M78 family)